MISSVSKNTFKGFRCSADKNFQARIPAETKQDGANYVCRSMRGKFSGEGLGLRFIGHHLMITTAKDNHQGIFGFREVSDISSAQKMRTFIKGVIASFRAQESLPKHVENLNKKYGLNIVLDNKNSKYVHKEKVGVLFSHVTNIAKALSSVKGIRQYNISLATFDSSSCGVFLEKSGFKKGFDFEVGKAIKFPRKDVKAKRTDIKRLIMSLEHTLKYLKK